MSLGKRRATGKSWGKRLKREGKGRLGEHAPGPFGIMLERR